MRITACTPLEEFGVTQAVDVWSKGSRFEA